MFMMSEGYKSGNSESHTNLKLGIVNIQGIFSNFVDSESFIE